LRSCSGQACLGILSLEGREGRVRVNHFRFASSPLRGEGRVRVRKKKGRSG